MKKIIRILFIFLLFYFVLFLVMFPSSKPGYDTKNYETIEDFEEDTEMIFYRMYSLYDYVIDDKKILLGEDKNCEITCLANSKDSYSLSDKKKNDYQIFYGKTSPDEEDDYYERIGDKELSIKKENDYLSVLCSSDRLSYQINLYVDNYEEYFSKISEYVKEVDGLNTIK